MKEELRNKNFTTEEVPPLPLTEEIIYKADSDDMADQETAKYMNKYKCPIKLARNGHVWVKESVCKDYE